MRQTKRGPPYYKDSPLSKTIYTLLLLYFFKDYRHCISVSCEF